MKRFVGFAACAAMLVFSLAFMGCASASSTSATSASSGSASSASAQASGASSSSASSEASSATSASSSAAAASQLANGTYSAKFDTDSSMFHVNESKDGRGELTVTDDGMVIHVTLVSKKVVNLYAGTADQAKEDADGVIQPTLDTVTYSDGAEEEVYGFDVPVPALDEEFDVALLGEKGKWYDHKVTVSDPIAE